MRKESLQTFSPPAGTHNAILTVLFVPKFTLVVQRVAYGTRKRKFVVRINANATLMGCRCGSPAGSDAVIITMFLCFAGVFSSSLQLSDQPPLGSWVITVTAAVTSCFVL